MRISLSVEEVGDLIEVLEAHDFCSDWLVMKGIPFIARFKKARERHFLHRGLVHAAGQRRFIAKVERRGLARQKEVLK